VRCTPTKALSAGRADLGGQRAPVKPQSSLPETWIRGTARSGLLLGVIWAVSAARTAALTALQQIGASQDQEPGVRVHIPSLSTTLGYIVGSLDLGAALHKST
jgi:hypothetical protein